MIHYSAANVVCLFTSSIMSCAVLASCANRRHFAGSWPSVAGYAALTLATNLILPLLRFNGHRYFLAFWALAILDHCFRLWMLADVIRNLPISPYLPKGSWASALSAGVVVAFGCIVLTSHVPSNYQHRLAFMYLFSRCTSLTVASFLTMLLIAVRQRGFAWRLSGARVAYGLWAMAASNLIVLHSFSFISRHAGQIADTLDGMVFVCSSTLWLAATAAHQPVEPQRKEPCIAF